MEMKLNIENIITSADRVLELLSAMSDEELLRALDACAGGEVAYAFNAYAHSQSMKHLTSLSANYSFSVTPHNDSWFVVIDNSSTMTPLQILQAMNDEDYALAA